MPNPIPPTQVVVFGASGDLAGRKLIPALTSLAASRAFKEPLQVIGVARRPKTSEAWRDELYNWLEDDAQRGAWRGGFAEAVHYVSADVQVAGQAEALGQTLDALALAQGFDPHQTGRLFYLALGPDLFLPVVEALSSAGLLSCACGEACAFRRVIIEKPFGKDYASARQLNLALQTFVREEQLFRIDHYLGKETVQNLLAFRFQNAIFEPLWSRQHIESVEISVCERLGMESGRGGYYDHAGALRDMVQNHLLQVLALVAMEAPASMEAEAIRSEKVKLLSSLSLQTPEQVHQDVIRGQYEGYRDEAGVASDSQTETYVAIRASIHNWRWSGVPFLLRTGKRLHGRFTQVVLRFKTPPVDLLGGPMPGDVCALRPNTLRLLIQPKEGIRLGFLVKQPGVGSLMQPANLGFDYRDLGVPSAPAYQRLLLDALEGNPTLFIRADEVEAAWRFTDALRAGWMDTPLHVYPQGSEGPAAADELFRGCEGVWWQGEAE